MFRKTIFATAMLLAGFSTASADQIILKNGDRLTGIVVKSDGKTLTLKSEFAGAVTVPLDAVTEITTTDPVYVTLKDSQTIVGSVTPSADRLEARTAEAGVVAFTRDSIQALRNQEEQLAFEAGLDRLRNPRLRDLWTGSVDAGLSLTRGNAETTTLSFGFNAARETTRDKISAFMNTLYARNSTTGRSLTTANAKRGGVRYDLNVSDRAFAFGLGDLENDQFQKLDLRVVLGGGMGWHARKSETTTLDFFGGGSLNREYFSTGLNRSSGEALVGQEFTHKLGSRSSLKERLVFLPNLSETGEYRLNFDASFVTALSTRLGWHVTFSNRYLSNPIAGTKASDSLLTTGLRIGF